MIVHLDKSRIEKLNVKSVKKFYSFLFEMGEELKAFTLNCLQRSTTKAKATLIQNAAKLKFTTTTVVTTTTATTTSTTTMTTMATQSQQTSTFSGILHNSSPLCFRR